MLIKPERLARPITIKLTLPQANMLSLHTPMMVHGGRLWDVGEELTFRYRIRLEPWCLIQIKNYRPMLGGFQSHGLATIGFQSYSASGLPEAITIGRYCSIADAVSFVDSQHPLNAVATSLWTHKSTPLVKKHMRPELAALILICILTRHWASRIRLSSMMSGLAILSRSRLV